jgi:flagellar biosynthesis/type III secretory pathway M-ring protein FliF/YscJ
MIVDAQGKRVMKEESNFRKYVVIWNNQSWVAVFVFIFVFLFIFLEYLVPEQRKRGKGVLYKGDKGSTGAHQSGAHKTKEIRQREKELGRTERKEKKDMSFDNFILIHGGDWYV